MLKRDYIDALSGFVILAIAAYMLLKASKINAPANVYPLVILITVMSLACLWSLSAIRRALRAQAASTTPAAAADTPRSLKIGGIILAMIAYAFAMQFDYTLATGAFLFVMFLSLGPGDLSLARALKAALMAAALTVFLYVAFVIWLNVSVPNMFQ